MENKELRMKNLEWRTENKELITRIKNKELSTNIWEWKTENEEHRMKNWELRTEMKKLRAKNWEQSMVVMFLKWQDYMDYPGISWTPEIIMTRL